MARASFLGLQLVQLLVTATLVLPAAIFFGMAFPAVIAATTESLSRVAGGVARVTVWNTFGTVAGAFLGGFVLVPRLGLKEAMLAATAASAAAALATLAAFPMPRRRLLAGVAGLAALAALLAPAWPRNALASGAGFFAGNYKTVEDWRAAARNLKLLYYKDGVSTTLSVDEAEGQRFYRSNGKTDASTAPSDMAVQVLIGQVGMLLHPDPKDVFVLGLGTGVSAAAVARHPVRSIDIVDIEPAGVAAAAFFEADNRRILADPRVRYINADGRNALLARPKTYDVIISDPSDIWVAGVGNLFTREFYEIARSRLKPGGVMVQWWHTHALAPEHLKLIVATFRSVFPHTSYWRPNLGDVILAGSADAVPWDFAALRRKFETVPGLADDLRGIGVWSPASLFGAFVLSGEDLDRLLAGVGRRPHRRPSGHRVLRPALPVRGHDAGQRRDDRGRADEPLPGDAELRSGEGPGSPRNLPARIRAGIDEPLHLGDPAHGRQRAPRPPRPEDLDRPRQPVPGAVPAGEGGRRRIGGRSPLSPESPRPRSSSPRCCAAGRTRRAPKPSSAPPCASPPTIPR